MNFKLVALAFGKLAEAASLFQEHFDQASTTPALAASTAPEKAPVKPAAATKPAATKPAAAKPKAAPVVEEPAEEIADEADDLADVEDETPAVTKDEVRKSLVAYAKKHGKEKAYALLEKHGSKNTEGLKEEVLPKVMAEIQKGLK